MRARVAAHHHPCQRCGRKTQCPGTWEENWDGWPEVICPEWHLPSGYTNPDFLCDDCATAPEREEEVEEVAR